MQWASYGSVRSVVNRATQKIFTRSIHIPLPRPPVAVRPTATQRVVKTTQTLVSQFFTHLTTPGTLRVPVPAGSARSLQHAATRTQSIKQGLSLPARHALGRPLGAPCLPRAPVVPRSITQVGLGTARNFSSARPVFQAIADNVPIGIRGLIEADLDFHGAKLASKRPTKMAPSSSKKGKGKQMMKENAQPIKAAIPVQEATVEEQINHYFPAATIAPVTTYVIVPLAPNVAQTPRRPLRERPAEYLPMNSFAAMHASFGTHALRVSSLFTRLDDAKVLNDPHVKCTTEAFGDYAGACTTLRITFEGWTEERVRTLLGDAGRGWCEIVEEQAEDDADSVLNEHASEAGERMSWDGSLSVHATVDPAQSLVLPTIDVSSSTEDQARNEQHISSSTSDDGSWSPGSLSPNLSPSRDEEVLSDFSLSDEEDGDAYMYGLSAPSSPRRSTTATSWIGVEFSSRFADAMSSPRNEAPMEYLF
jgi:hypothetical protein